MTKAQQSEQNEARETLRKLFPPGSRVGTILRHVSRSGMSRSISVVVQDEDGIRDVSYLVARALGDKIDRDRGGVKVGGCGMDMGFSLVYNLSATLYPEGFGCVGADPYYRVHCPSNDHTNGDRDYTPHCYQGNAWYPGDVEKLPSGPVDDTRTGGNYVHWHRNGGYALRHYWI